MHRSAPHVQVQHHLARYETEYFEFRSHAESHVIDASVRLATESASEPDRERGSIPPNDDDDWKLDQVDPNEWGRGCREKGRSRFEEEYAEEEQAFRRVRATWSATTQATGRVRGVGSSASRDRGDRGRRSLKPSAKVAEGRHSDGARLRREPQQQQRISADSCARATPEGNLRNRGRHQLRNPMIHHRRHRSQTAAVSPERTRRAGRSGGWSREGGVDGGGSEEEFGGWWSAPEGSSGGVGVGGGRRKPHSVRRGVGGNVGTCTDWRSRGALGRRPASREAARQLRVSERLHRLAQAMAKKKERARQRRDDLQQARVRKATRE